MHRALQFVCLLSLGLFITHQIGCNGPKEPTASEADDHDHDHDHDRLSFGQAIGKIEELAGTIGQSMAKGDSDAAHEPLHEIGHLLEELPHLAKDEGLSEQQQASLDAAVNQLMDAYGAVDAIMHGEDGKSYDDVKEEIAASLKTLESFEHSHE